MYRITILANSALAVRLFLKTPFFDLLKKDKNNYIKVFTTSGNLTKSFKADNVKIFSIKRWFFLNKLGLKREWLIPLFYKLKGVFDCDIMLFAEWATPESFAILKEAKNKKIPTLFVQEGAMNPTDDFPVNLYPDKLAVWGDVAKGIYIEKGIERSKIFITGQPRFDWYYEFKPSDLKLNRPKRVLFASQALWRYPDSYVDADKIISDTIEIIARVCRELGLDLYCKLHPSDNEKLYKIEGVKILVDPAVSKKKQTKWFCSTGYDPDISDLKNLVKLISSFDVVITMLSTLGLEAMILKKPAIFFDMAEYYRNSQINIKLKTEANFAFVHNEQDFRNLLELYIKNPEAHLTQAIDFLYKFLYKDDGKASERLRNLIYDELRYNIASNK